MIAQAMQGATIYILALAANWAVVARICRARGIAVRIIPAAWGMALAGACGSAFAASASVVETAATGLLAATVVTCAATDLSSGYVFDVTTLPATVLMLALAGLDGRFGPALLGSACSGVTLLLLHVMTRGRGLGLGDAKLAAAIGVGLGSTTALAAVSVAFVSGAILGICALLMRRVRVGDSIPFAPYLAFGTLVCIMWGTPHG